MDATGEPMGEVLREGGRYGLRYERRLSHPPEKVWRALTESDQLRHWFPCDIVGERRTGAEVALPFWPDHVERWSIEEPVVTGRILTWDPPSVFEWDWSGDTLRWELEPVDGGTVLTLTTWLAADDPSGAAGAGAGYHVCLDQLRELLDSGGTATPLVDMDTAPWQGRYSALMEAAR